MERIQENTKKTFELDDFYFHYVNDEGISVLCMSDKKMNRKHCFAFLQDTKKKLLEDYTSINLERATAYSLPAFSLVLRDKIVSSIHNHSLEAPPQKLCKRSCQSFK